MKTYFLLLWLLQNALSMDFKQETLQPNPSLSFVETENMSLEETDTNMTKATCKTCPHITVIDHIEENNINVGLKRILHHCSTPYVCERWRSFTSFEWSSIKSTRWGNNRNFTFVNSCDVEDILKSVNSHNKDPKNHMIAKHWLVLSSDDRYDIYTNCDACKECNNWKLNCYHTDGSITGSITARIRSTHCEPCPGDFCLTSCRKKMFKKKYKKTFYKTGPQNTCFIEYEKKKYHSNDMEPNIKLHECTYDEYDNNDC